MAVMQILAAEALLRENKKIQWKMLSPVGDLAIINRPWLYEDPKFSDANIGIRDFTMWKKKSSEKCYP